MKIAITLIIGVILGVVISHTGPGILGDTRGQINFAALHGNTATADSPGADGSNAVALMNTDTALCDQPYFAEVYALAVEFFSGSEEEITAENLAALMFDHARHSGHFTAEEAEGWIEHIKAIPGQFVEIYREDPTVIDNCYNFQVAAVGPGQ